MSKGTYTPGYRVTRDGRVFSCATNWRGYGEREMGQPVNSHGYPTVRLVVDGRRKRFAVHRLVAWEYLPPKPSPEHEIRHLDGNKMNSHADNLAWGTRQDNADDRERHGRTSRGAAHAAAIRASSHADAVRAYFRSRQEAQNV